MSESGAGRFATSRRTGKNNQQVIVEHVHEAPPGTTFSYADLAAVLSADTDRVYGRKDVQQVVRLANVRLLREHSRRLRVVQGVGYQVAHARDHCELAGVHNRKGTNQFKWALLTLENVRLDEMTEQQRAVHIAQAEINAALVETNRRIQKKQVEQSRLIASLTSRVEQVEARGN